MTTPAPTAPTLTIATDQPIYQTGDTVTLTATYVDSNGVSATVTVNATATDTNTPPNTATASTTFQVGQASDHNVTRYARPGDSDTGTVGGQGPRGAG